MSHCIRDGGLLRPSSRWPCACCPAGTTSGIPLDATDATVAARKLHDACTTCHNSDGDATLKAAYGRAQAMPNGGELHISTRVTADNTAIIEFRDTGTGFAPEDAEAVFEPFFTTKEVGQGTGLGLSISHGIVERHGGSMKIKSKVGQGTTVTVRLPSAARLPASASPVLNSR